MIKHEQTVTLKDCQILILLLLGQSVPSGDTMYYPVWSVPVDIPWWAIYMWFSFFLLIFMCGYLAFFWFCWLFAPVHGPSLAANRDFCPIVVSGLLIAVTCLIAEHGLPGHVGPWVVAHRLLPHGVWHLLDQRWTHVPAPAGSLFTAGPPGEVLYVVFWAGSHAVYNQHSSTFLF